MLDYVAIGQRIRTLRKERNLSQEQLAEKVWISTTHMSHIETGSTKLSLPVLVDLAAALGTGADDILQTRRGEQTPESVLELLDGCTPYQARVILEIVKAAKAAMDGKTE